MRIKYLAVLIVSMCFLATCHWWQTRKMPKAGPALSSQDAAAEIFHDQNAVNACAGSLPVEHNLLDVTKEEFVEEMTKACTTQELTLIARYWNCFSNQLICPLKWAAGYQKAGDNCRPLPKLSEKCCEYYSIEWTGEKGKRHRSCQVR